MKEFYFLLLCIISAILLSCIMYANRTKSKVAQIICRLICSALIGTAAYALYIAMPNLAVATAADGLYFWATDFMCYYMLKFAFAYTEYPEDKMPLELLLRAFIVVDGAFFACNNIHRFMFDVISINGQYGFNGVYIEHFTGLQYTHLLCCYAMIIFAIIRFLYKTVNSSQIYKSKYFAIVLPLAGAIVCNIISVCFGMSVDISILLYSFLAIIICYIALHLVPYKLIETAQMYIAENTRQGILCFDENDHCIYINRIIRDIVDEDSLEKIELHYRELHKTNLEDGADNTKWCEKVIKNGKDFYYLNVYQRLVDKHGKEMGYFFTITDDTENVKQYEKEKYKASHDSLTDLLNRESFFEEVNKAIEENPDEPRYMLVSDIKDFKLVNNLYGEKFGDEILKMQADLIGKHKTDSICGRIAGDKFGMLLKKDRFDKRVFSEAVNTIKEYTGSRNLDLHYHIGIYDVTGIKEDAQILYNRVTLAISGIHNDYQKVFVEYDDNIMKKVMEKKCIISDFDRALAEKQFCMYLQPQISSKDGKMVGAEALVRWKHPTRGMLFPDSFIEILEESSLIHMLDLEIWNQAAEKLAQWKKEGKEDIYISINISVRDFYYLDVFEELVNIVEEKGIDPGNLKLEITESAVMSDKKNNFATLGRLKDYGFDLELDDFGSGYSSLNMLKDFHVDVLKIDRMFLKETDNIEKSRVILEMVIHLAKRLEMQVITEGVETADQVNSLSMLGCDYFQGYYYDRPISVSEFENKYVK